MSSTALLDILALCCAALIGFAAHRASLCNVRAVAEVMTTRSAHMLWSLLQAVVWMVTLTGVLVLGFGLVPQPALARTPMLLALAGGLLFGIGAAVNGGCSLSTLTRLADGHIGMAATLSGFALGVATWLAVPAVGWQAALTPLPSPWLRWPDLAPGLLALLLAWALHRAWGLWQLARARPQGPRKPWLLAPTYPLSVSAALMGLAAGLLYATQGAWSYTSYLRTEVLHTLGDVPAASAWHGGLVLSLVAGMLASSLQRRTFAWTRPQRLGGWLRHAGGGVLMGAGAAMVPGGNDTLLLGSLPTITLAAVGTYLCMLMGIALVLWMMRVARAPMPALACSASGCDEQSASPTKPAPR
ncbi:MAG: YeeE/YedE family protein [Burkholderiales bacterium]|nr:YeeE/YedE family protein [Burkholderiales bacterium]